MNVPRLPKCGQHTLRFYLYERRLYQKIEEDAQKNGWTMPDTIKNALREYYGVRDIPKTAEEMAEMGGLDCLDWMR